MLHIATFYLDIDSQKTSLWHNLAPRSRILCTALIVLAIALTPNGHWWTWGIYGFSLTGVIWLSQVTLKVLLKRIAIEFAFISVVLLGTLFRDGGTLIWSWGILKVTTVGLTILGSVTLKAVLSLLMLNLLTLTTSVPDLLKGLVTLRTPPLLVAILASMYRYISVLSGEFHAMRRAAMSRNLMVTAASSRHIIGNMIGALFIRTYERGERVHQAMLSRGYLGLPPVETVSLGGWQDLAALTGTGIVALLGQAVYWFP